MVEIYLLNSILISLYFLTAIIPRIFFTTLAAKVEVTELNSPGATSTTYIPIKFFISILLVTSSKFSQKSENVQPSGSGSPVSGAILGSKTSMSTVR